MSFCFILYGYLLLFFLVLYEKLVSKTEMETISHVFLLGNLIKLDTFLIRTIQFNFSIQLGFKHLVHKTMNISLKLKTNTILGDENRFQVVLSKLESDH